MQLFCIFDLQDTLIKKDGSLLFDVNDMNEVLRGLPIKTLLYSVNEPWSLMILNDNPLIAELFDEIFLVKKKNFNDVIWSGKNNVNTVVVGDGLDAELAFARRRKISVIDVNDLNDDLSTALNSTLKELCNGAF